MAEESRSTRLMNWLTGPVFPMYAVYFTASWGRRMWTFALGLYLVKLAGDDVLLLTAIYGFSIGISVLLLGSLIGYWIDKHSRIKVVRTTLVMNKLCVILCTVAICLVLSNTPKSSPSSWPWRPYCQAGVIILAVLGDLANMAYKFISLEKDWFIVVTAGDSGSLANLNAFTRSIDLVANIAAPIVTGQVMTYGNELYAGLFIICWHFLAIFTEYFLLRRVYKLVPALAKKEIESVDHKNPDEKELEHLRGGGDPDSHDTEHETSSNDESCLSAVVDHIMVPFRGWKAYGEQKVMFAGLALAALYMTVLGFDGITTGYIYSNGISASIVGISLAMGSFAGVVGAFLYTRVRQCLGLVRTGIVAFLVQMSCLSLCVISIWAPGSPFDPNSLMGAPSLDNGQIERNCSNALSNSSSIYWGTNSTDSPPCGGAPDEKNPMSPSIIMFLIGIITSRIGLWMADLVVSQLFQENVPEHERGIVNGVQNSINQLLDMIKFILVIILPKLHTFGFLILLSFMSIFIANFLFWIQGFKSSGKSVSKCLSGELEKGEEEGEEAKGVIVKVVDCNNGVEV